MVIALEEELQSSTERQTDNEMRDNFKSKRAQFHTCHYVEVYEEKFYVTQYRQLFEYP